METFFLHSPFCVSLNIRKNVQGVKSISVGVDLNPGRFTSLRARLHCGGQFRDIPPLSLWRDNDGSAGLNEFRSLTLAAFSLSLSISDTIARQMRRSRTITIMAGESKI